MALSPRSLGSLTVEEVASILHNKWGWHISFRDNTITVSKQDHTGHSMAHGKLSDFPGSHVLVSHDLFVNENQRRQGLSTAYGELIERIANRLERGRIMAYVCADNEAQQERLPAFGWTEIAPRIWMRDLTPYPEALEDNDA